MTEHARLCAFCLPPWLEAPHCKASISNRWYALASTFIAEFLCEYAKESKRATCAQGWSMAVLFDCNSGLGCCTANCRTCITATDVMPFTFSQSVATQRKVCMAFGSALWKRLTRP